VARMSIYADRSNPNTRSNKELIDEFHKDCELQDLTDETIRRYMSCILIFQNDFLAPQQISLVEVNKEILKDFLHYLMRVRKVNPKTIGAYFSALSSLYEYLEFEGYRGRLPIHYQQ
jgi:site-specific recombinase XerD